jgi:hypothetical protein
MIGVDRVDNNSRTKATRRRTASGVAGLSNIATTVEREKRVCRIRSFSFPSDRVVRDDKYRLEVDDRDGMRSLTATVEKVCQQTYDAKGKGSRVGVAMEAR